MKRPTFPGNKLLVQLAGPPPSMRYLQAFLHGTWIALVTPLVAFPYVLLWAANPPLAHNFYRACTGRRLRGFPRSTEATLGDLYSRCAQLQGQVEALEARIRSLEGWRRG